MIQVYLFKDFTNDCACRAAAAHIEQLLLYDKLFM